MIINYTSSRRDCKAPFFVAAPIIPSAEISCQCFFVRRCALSSPGGRKLLPHPSRLHRRSYRKIHQLELRSLRHRACLRYRTFLPHHVQSPRYRSYYQEQDGKELLALTSRAEPATIRWALSVYTYGRPCGYRICRDPAERVGSGFSVRRLLFLFLEIAV